MHIACSLWFVPNILALTAFSLYRNVSIIEGIRHEERRRVSSALRTNAHSLFLPQKTSSNISVGALHSADFVKLFSHSV